MTRMKGNSSGESNASSKFVQFVCAFVPRDQFKRVCYWSGCTVVKFTMTIPHIDPTSKIVATDLMFVSFVFHLWHTQANLRHFYNTNSNLPSYCSLISCCPATYVCPLNCCFPRGSHVSKMKLAPHSVCCRLISECEVNSKCLFPFFTSHKLSFYLFKFRLFFNSLNTSNHTKLPVGGRSWAWTTSAINLLQFNETRGWIETESGGCWSPGLSGDFMLMCHEVARSRSTVGGNWAAGGEAGGCKPERREILGTGSTGCELVCDIGSLADSCVHQHLKESSYIPCIHLADWHGKLLWGGIFLDMLNTQQSRQAKEK